ncbi:MAG: hypothetical protein IT443_10840 [Phycisphaeraceae bacterium]|nr:hypothetical protein [Phycisphaeraceae bacterium]
MISRRLSAGLGLACGGLGVLMVATCVLVAVAHRADLSILDHASGAWIALADWARQGTLYPPLFDGQHFGGTRFMPVSIVLHAGLAGWIGDYIVAGKMLNLATALALGAVLFTYMRRLGVARGLALLLASLPLWTDTGWLVTRSIRNDALPVALQVLALLVLGMSPGRLVLAAGLCALAVGCKLSAVWAGLAIVLWLLIHHRRGLIWFLGGGAVSLAALLMAFELYSQGRMSENLLALAFAGSDAQALALPLRLGKGLLRLVFALGRNAPLFAALTPLAGLDVILATAQRSWSVVHWSLLTVVLVGAVQFADSGVIHNHLIDVLAVLVLVLGDLWMRTRPLCSHARVSELASRRSLSQAQFILLLAVLTLPVFEPQTEAYLQSVPGALRQLGGGPPAPASLDPAHIVAALDHADPILCEDPLWPVLLGRHPVVMDAFMLLRLERIHPSWGDSLIERLDQREFTFVILHDRLDNPANRHWFTFVQFGPRVTAAIERNYQYQGVLGNYATYVPRPARK